jgi:CheY-like chemotaxis protein
MSSLSARAKEALDMTRIIFGSQGGLMKAEVGNRSTEILIVEDDVLVRMIASDILTDAGFRVYEAHDAHEAIALLEARSDVRVVFTDWNMPGDIDGMELARLVRKRWPAISVIVTSGKMRPPGELPAGVRFLAKPYRPLALIEEIEIMVQGSASEVAEGAPVLPQGIAAHTPLMAEIGGIGIAAAQREPDKT